MAVLQYKTLSTRTVAALSVERDTVFYGIAISPASGSGSIRPAARSSSPRRAVLTDRTGRTSQGG